MDERNPCSEMDLSLVLICSHVQSSSKKHTCICPLYVHTRCIPESIKFRGCNSLCDAEGAGGLLDTLPGTLEPPLVSGLRLADVELAVGDGGRDELVLAALVAVRRPGQHRDAVVLLPVDHRLRALQEVGRRHLAGLEPAL
uniref:Uncharacterized protein n=1 Tax=Arundo donax TaxID=35708 RepID=A0A0A9D9U6_ARUDO